jgi:nitroreductase
MGDNKMNVTDAVLTRQSIRTFKPDPIPPDILKKIVETALRSPSSGNSQPCEYAVVSGSKLDEIKQAVVANLSQMPNPDIPSPMSYPEPWKSRYAGLMHGVQEMMGITREDKQKRADWNLWGMKMWGAPTCIYVYIDKNLYNAVELPNSLNIFDCGLVSQTIMLLAVEHGLGTIPALMTVFYPDILRRVLGLPANKLFVVGLPIGYPDWDHPANKFHSAREPLEKVAKFY